MDPQNYNGLGGQLLISFAYESLIYSPHDGSGYQPYLAKSWDIDPEGMHWTFHLRDDVTWSTGDPLTADDVVYSVERFINGAPELSWKSQYLPAASYAEKIDDYTVKIGFTAPSPMKI